jgi:hypothetical protein
MHKTKEFCFEVCFCGRFNEAENGQNYSSLISMHGSCIDNMWSAQEFASRIALQYGSMKWIDGQNRFLLDHTFCFLLEEDILAF